MRDMHGIRKLSAVMAAALLGGGLTILAASPASAATIVVNPGQSIQAAVDAAPPGSTILVRPGTYFETVTITKTGTRLQGSGPSSTRLLPPADPGGPCAFGPDFVQGICVLGDFDFSTFSVRAPVRAVSITGFSVSGFSGSGIFVLGGSGTNVEGNRLDNNGEYGPFVLESTTPRVVSNQASGNHEAGLYIGNSPDSNATVRANTASDNGFGIFIRSASKGTISGNTLQDNCIGLLFLGEPDSPTGWVATGNVANHNNRACPASDEGPPVSGIGIQVLGGSNINIYANTANDNRPSGPTLGTAGIGVIDSALVTVSRNTALGNDLDLFWDSTGRGVRFLGNRCATSVPPGFC